MKKLLLSVVCLLVSGSALAMFQSPTGNIVCRDFGSQIGCYIKKSTAKQPVQPKPADCHYQWGGLFLFG